MSFVQHATNAQNAASNLPVGARLQNFGRPESSSNSERGLHPPLSSPTKTHKVSHSHKLLCQSPQEQLPVGGIASAYKQKHSGASTKPNLSGVLQPAVFGPKAQQQVETYIRSEQPESFPQGGKIQNGDTGNHQDIPPTRGVGHVNRLQGHLLPHTNTGTVQEISEISCPRSDIPVQSLALWSVDSTLGVHGSGKGGKTDGHTQGYKDPPVPRRLVGESYIPPGLSPAHPRSSTNLSRTSFDFVGYQFDLRAGLVRPTPDRWQNLQDKILEILSLPTCPVQQFMSLIGLLTTTEKQVHLGRLHMRPIQWHLKSHWRMPESLEKVIPIPRSLHPHLQWWLQGDNILTGQPLPNKACSANLYRRIKRRVGRSLKRTHCKRVMVPTRKQAAHKLSGVKSSLSSTERVPKPLYRQDSTCGNRQHYSSVIHKQRRRHEVGAIVPYYGESLPGVPDIK